MIVVYTAILGGSDSLKPAPVGADRCVCFVDDLRLYPDSRGWDLVPFPPGLDPRRTAWQLRCLAHELFPQATVTVWTDASFTLTNLSKLLQDAHGRNLSALGHQARKTCYEEGAEVVRVGQARPKDVARQLDRYRAEGFSGGPLSIACIIVRQTNAAVTAFNVLWDAEIKQHPGDNTQLSLDYAAWKTRVGVHRLPGARKDNPYATHDHRDHKKRRKPYR